MLGNRKINLIFADGVCVCVCVWPCLARTATWGGRRRPFAAGVRICWCKAYMPVKKGQALGFIHHERTKYGCKDRGVLLLKQYHKHGIFLWDISRLRLLGTSKNPKNQGLQLKAKAELTKVNEHFDEGSQRRVWGFLEVPKSSFYSYFRHIFFELFVNLMALLFDDAPSADCRVKAIELELVFI